MLETFVLNKDDVLESDDATTWGSVSSGTDLFTNSDHERFLRLVVYDHLPTSDGAGGEERRVYDSRMGIAGRSKTNHSVSEFGQPDTNTNDYEKGSEKNLIGHVRVPIDFDEWYFIVANYNPLINQEGSNAFTTYNQNSDYWRGNIDDPTGEKLHYSGYGNKCKVEIISKTDLLRARGYKV